MKINKIEITRGIQWIDIPDANLRLLCGCPADTVKHLIKRGLILTKEVDGITFETGPNAILLSDVLLQNGELSNLAEFPVLQMLYKQGLIIPNHPNNKGQKPLLIGSSEQIDSQMRYIYRGNYGLVSREEMIEAGATEEEAAEMMRLKLKFAFGCIRPTSDFIDTHIIGRDNKVDVVNGVHLQRIKTNVFELSYHDERVLIDLNLELGTTYECAYQLGFRKFEPEYFAVIHSGDGDGWDANRPSMSSIITYQGGIYLIDAGPHIVNTMAALGIGIDQVDGIFHTHAHDDHFAGLSTLMRAGHKIRYFATPLVRASVEKKLAALLGFREEHFANFFDIHDLVFDKWNNFNGLEIMPIFSPHPVETNIFVFRTLWTHGYRTYAHFADIVALTTLKAMVTEQDDIHGLGQKVFNRILAAYLTPYDIKKIDVGGGLIHGDAKDFINDKSKRILLAHRATDLTNEEKEIGSSAAFGSVDILIKGQSDIFRRHAFAYLESNLPGISFHDLRMLINHPITQANPGTIFMKEGDKPSELLLLLSGQVEKICTKDGLFGSLSAGSIIGDETLLDNGSSQYTYRSSSFTRLLRLSRSLYTEVIRRNGLFESVRHFINMRTFLNTTSLFSEGLPVRTLRHIINNATERHFPANSIIDGRDIQVINIIRHGLIKRTAGHKVLDILQPQDFFGEEHAILKMPNALQQQDFFGEEHAILKMPSLFQLHVIENTTVVQIPGDFLKNIPAVLWKIFANYQKQVLHLVRSDNSTEMFVWQNSFSIHVAEMDNQHKRLIEIANRIMDHLYNDADHESILNAFDALVNYARHHFSAEEKLLDLYNYPHINGQRKSHNRLIQQVIEYKEKVMSGYIPDRSDFLNFIEGWLIRHILDEDREYGAFLNDKGVY